MTRRSFLASAAPALLLGQKTTAERPNVLFIASDDMNNSLGCYGHPMVKSPNLDRLAARATRFNRAYCQYPVCGPSRASLMTGLRPDTTKIFDNQIAVRQTMPDVLTLPQMFKNSGWRSVRAGKMYHMDVPGSVGTNKWDDPPSWDVSISPPGAEQKTKGAGRNIGKTARWDYVAFQGEGKDQADEKATEIAIETLHANRDRPWFFGLGYLRPHVPHVAPERFFDLYPLSSINPVSNPTNDLDDIPLASEMTINTRARDVGGMNEQDKKEAIRAYYASVSYMDWQVGRVLDALEKTGQAQRTIVVFWGDHGWHLGEHFRWHKRSLFEESMRAPLIISAPDRKAGHGKGCNSIVEFVDIYPTLAELSRLTPPANLEGQSLVPLLENPARKWKQAAFSVVTSPGGIVGRAAVTERYRYIRWTGPHPGEELYDRQTDPKEYTNLAGKDLHKGVLDQMRKVLDSGWQAARAKV